MTNLEKAQAIEKLLATRYQPTEYPSLLDQAARFRSTRPFAGCAVLDGTPLFTNTLAKYLPLLYGGAALTVSVSARVPFDPAVRKVLDELEIPAIEDGVVADGRFDVIMDCDGTRAATKPRVGVCELTRSGAYHYEKATIPVVLVDDSRIKEIETTLGTGDGYMRAMRQFGYADWRNQRVIIFGYGKVGRGVAYACAREGARVTVVDRPSIPVDKAHVDRLVDCQDVGAVRQAVAESRHLVTATGIRGAMRRYGLDAEILKKMVIAAIGIEDEWLEALDPSLILNHGEAVNFSLDEPTRLRYIDPTMALMNESAVDLLTGRVAKPGISSPDPLSEQRCLTPVVNAGLITEEISLFEVLGY